MSLTIWLVTLFLVAVAAVVYVNRRKLAEVQALIFGGTIGPGCVVAQAILVLLIAVAFIIAANSGLI